MKTAPTNVCPPALELVKMHLKEYNIPKDIFDRYASMLIQRAVRFYLEGHLDSEVVKEDLYDEHDRNQSEACTCPSTSDANRYNHLKGCPALNLTHRYPNLASSEHELCEKAGQDINLLRGRV